MKVGILQCNPVTGDCMGNADQLFSLVGKAAAQGVELCIAPELVICGPNANDLLQRNSFLAQCKKALELLADKLFQEGLPPLVLGTPLVREDTDLSDSLLQNGVAFLEGGRVSIVGGANELSPLDHKNNPFYFTSSSACGVINVKGKCLAVTIGQGRSGCSSFDLYKKDFFTTPLAKLLNTEKVDCIINIEATPFAQGGPQCCQKITSWIASQSGVPVVFTNLVGGNDGLVYPGNSFAVNKEGDIIVQAPLFEECILYTDFEKEHSGVTQATMPVEEELWKAMVLGVKDFAAKCGISKAIVGLSGGVDSALAACVGAAALGAENITAVLMPSPYSSSGSVDDAMALAINLGMRTHTLPLLPVLDGYRSLFSSVFDKGLYGVTEENIQARIRGAMVMAFGNEYNAMILNTGNKSEAAVGYCTLYGDQVGALSVIGDLFKKQVYAVCHWINANHNNLIPEAILEKAPSAELSPGQKDSDSLPPYDILDGILGELLEQGKSFNEIVGAGYDSDTVKEVLALVKRAQFKRMQAPPAIQLSSSSFAAIWKMPIASRVDFR